VIQPRILSKVPARNNDPWPAPAFSPQTFDHEPDERTRKRRRRASARPLPAGTRDRLAVPTGFGYRSASMNRLPFGDNLKPSPRDAAMSFLPQWLTNKNVFPDASVELVYLDPPFNSNADAC